MHKILFSDHDYHDISLERDVLARQGIEIEVGDCRTEDDVIRAAKGMRGILLQYAPITERVVASLPELGIVSRIGAGFDTIDTAACAKHGVWVANSPDYGVGEVATHALALSLALVRNVVAWNRDVKAGTWHYTSAGPVKRASELTLGIVGLGRIGKRMAHVSRNLFRRVIAADPYLIDGDFPAYVERATLPSLFEQADVVSLHVPLNDETRGMIGSGLLASMRRGSYLVNTARGAVLDVHAALAALDRGTLAGLALDVLPREPVAADSPLAKHPRVILTPHSAFYSVESEKELRRKAAQNLATWFATGRPDYVVSPGTRKP